MQNAKITGLQYEAQFLIITVEGGTFTLYDTCDKSGEVMLLDETIRGDRQMSIMLAAYMAGKSVSFYTTGCVEAWDKKYPKIWAIKVQQ